MIVPCARQIAETGAEILSAIPQRYHDIGRHQGIGRRLVVSYKRDAEQSVDSHP